MLRVSDTYSIIKGSNNPLSSDVCLIEGKDNTYIFEAGNNLDAVNEINSIDKNKILIISHFHQDHLENFNRINYSKLYVGNNTHKYTNDGVIVNGDLIIDEDIKLEVFVLPNSHAKGSIGIKINEYAFIGDALAPQYKNNNYVYNVQMLKEEIEVLTKLDVEYFVSSHSMEKPVSKNKIIEHLNNIYAKKEKSNPYIIIDDEYY